MKTNFSFVVIQAISNLEEMRDIAARICRDYLNGAWKTISADDIQLKRIRYVCRSVLFLRLIFELINVSAEAYQTFYTM